MYLFVEGHLLEEEENVKVINIYFECLKIVVLSYNFIAIMLSNISHILS